ncbi:MAG: hypothetical protein P1V35_08730, partial [Planctomycetota bacterium]|nr:hypothetical protein [Planctomycetota bacterium]
MDTLSQTNLSVRGQKLAIESPMADCIVEHFTRVMSGEKGGGGQDASPGYVPLCIAENSLLKERVL